MGCHNLYTHPVLELAFAAGEVHGRKVLQAELRNLLGAAYLHEAREATAKTEWIPSASGEIQKERIPMFISNRVLFITLTQLIKMVGNPITMDGKTVMFSKDQFEMFEETTDDFIKHKCKLWVTNTLVVIRVGIAISMLIMSFTSFDPISARLGLYAFPFVALVLTYILEAIFKSRIVDWLASKHEIMLINVLSPNERYTAAAVPNE
jgi:hypothetical protein